jgi:hypothetical protein
MGFTHIIKWITYLVVKFNLISVGFFPDSFFTYTL